MKKISGQDLYDALGGVSDRHVSDAFPPSWRTETVADKPSRSHVWEFFLDNGWVAAVLSAVVAVGVIVAIVLAGRGEPVVPPVGTESSDTMEESETDETTETLAPESESETELVLPEVTVPASIAVVAPDGTVSYVEGELIYEKIVVDNELVTNQPDYPSSEDRIMAGVPVTVTMKAGSAYKIQGYVPEDWTVGYYKTVYTSNDHFDLPPTWLAQPPEVTDLSPGVYYMEYDLTREGPLISSIRKRESHRYRFIFRLVVTDEAGELPEQVSIEDWMDAPPSEGLTYASHGDGTCSLSGIGTFTGLHLVIPDHSPAGDRVTEISPTALQDNAAIATISVPGSVETIRKGTFVSCSNLQYIRFGEGVRCIEEQAFGEELGKLYLPASIAEIQGTGLAGCDIKRTYLTDLSAWCGVNLGTWVGANPLVWSREIYLNDEKLVDLVIPDGVTEIAALAFYDVYFRSITLSDSVHTIRQYAFGGTACNTLNELTLGSGLREVGTQSFQMDNIRRLNIPDIGAFASLNFAEAEDNPLLAAHEVYHDGALLEHLVIPDTVTRIGDHAFYQYKALKSVTLPDSPIEVGARAFGYCTELRTLKLGGVTRIGEEAFCKCPFNPLTLPATLTHIGDRAFAECNNIVTVHIPGSVREIGNGAFAQAERLGIITIDEGVTAIGNSAFSATQCSRINLPSTLEILGDFAFYHTNLGSITIPGSVKRIGESAFRACYYLYDVTIEEGVEVIGDGAFWDNRALTDIVFPDSVTTLEANALRDCQKLKSITLPAALTSIGEQAFELTGALTTVYFGGTEAEWTAANWRHLFAHCTVQFRT